MQSKTYLSVDSPASNIYRLSSKDYSRLKTWLQFTKQNYQPAPVLSSAFEYFPINYTYFFKKIKLQQSFAGKHVRTVNLVANNGLKIFASVQDQKDNVYLSKIYQKKGVFCTVDIVARTITLLQQMGLAFYTLDQRLPGKLGEGMGLKKLYFVLQFMLTTSDGDTFHLGYAKHCLADRHKDIVMDMQIYRVGDKCKVGYIQLTIDSPTQLGLSYFIPPNTITDSSTPIAPYIKFNIKQKSSLPSTPLPILPSYNISLHNFQININNYDRLIRNLQRCSPYFTEHHHQNIKMEVVKISVILGVHNGWGMISELPGVSKDSKDRDRSGSPRHVPAGKNISKVMQSQVQSKEIKKINVHSIMSTIKMQSPSHQQNQKQAKFITLKPQQPSLIPQIISMQSIKLPQSKLQNTPNISNSNSINMIYFDTQYSQLICILQFTLKYSIDSTLKQQKTARTNIFWAPITFNIGESLSYMELPMIQHIQLPGYPIQWNNVKDIMGNRNNAEISATLSYKCNNDNIQLHRNTKKQRLNSYSNNNAKRMASQQNIDSNNQKTYLERLIQDQRNGSNIDGNLLTVTGGSQGWQHASKINKTMQSITIKEQQVNRNIHHMIRTLQRSIRPKMRIAKNKISHQLLIPPQSLLPQQNSLTSISRSIATKSYTLKLRLREYLPCTDNPQLYYLPHNFHLTLYILRTKIQQIARIDKQSPYITSGIPILLQNPNKNNYHGFLFQINITNMKQWDAGVIEDGNNVVLVVQDLDNVMHYGIGLYPIAHLFINQQYTMQNNQSNQNKLGLLNNQSVQQQPQLLLQQQSNMIQNMIKIGNRVQKYFKIQINSNFNPELSHIRGQFIFESVLQQIQSPNINTRNNSSNTYNNNSNTHNNNTAHMHLQQINFHKAFQTLPQHDRQLLRIKAFNGTTQPSTRHDIIKNYKNKNHIAQVNQLTNQQFNNDLQMEYQIGQISYGWIQVKNTDKSENNLFTFHILDFQMLELVTDKTQYLKQAVLYKHNHNNNNQDNTDNVQLQNKVMVNLQFMLAKSGHSNNYYQARIPQGTSADFLVKLLHKQWSPLIKPIIICRIEVKRNTMPYKSFKMRLNYNPPLIDNIYHDQVLYKSNTSLNNQIRYRLPQYILQTHGYYLNSLTSNSQYNQKNNIISVVKINNQNIGQTGLQIQILMGVYFQKSCTNLKNIIILQLQIMQGENIILQLGAIQTVKIPVCKDNLRAADKIYRIQISNHDYQYTTNSNNKLYYFSQTDNSQPQLLLRSMRVIKDELVVNLISYEGRLIKKYLIQLQCKLPSRCRFENLTLEGFIGEKFVFMLKNPYQIDYGFYLTASTHAIIFKQVQQQKQQSGQFIFKIKGKMQFRITAELVDTINQQQYITLSDCQHSVVTIYCIKKKVKQSLSAVFQLGKADHIRRGSNSQFSDQFQHSSRFSHKKVYM